MAVSVDASPLHPHAPPGAGAGTLCAAFQRTLAADPGAPALRAHGGGRALSRTEYGRAVEELAGGLAGLGLGRGDTMALLLTNRPEFHLVDTAALHLGAVPFSLDPGASAEWLEDALRHAQSRVVVCERRFLEVVFTARAPRVEHVVLIDGPPTIGTVSLDQLRCRAAPGFDFRRVWQGVHPDDVATLVYGTAPDGRTLAVELTHANLTYVMDACHRNLPLRVRGACLSHLPPAEPVGRLFAHYLHMTAGHTITTVRDPEDVPAAVAETRPSWFAAGPHTWERLRADLQGRFAARPDATDVAAALDAATRRVALGQRGEWVGASLRRLCDAAESEVLGAARSELGLSECDLMVSTAGLALDTQEFFLALGLPLAEVYGSAEAGVLTTLPPPGGIRIGSIGVALPGTEARIAADGELLVRGPHVMRGYRADPGRTRAIIDPEGWLHTGELAAMDEAGYVRAPGGPRAGLPRPRRRP